jgi:hypothetical protein
MRQTNGNAARQSHSHFDFDRLIALVPLKIVALQQMIDVLVSGICAAVLVVSVLVDGKTLPAPPRGTRRPKTHSTVRAGNCNATIPHAAMAVDINATRMNFCTRQLFAHTRARRADVVEIIRDREIAGGTTNANERLIRTQRCSVLQLAAGSRGLQCNVDCTAPLDQLQSFIMQEHRSPYTHARVHGHTHVHKHTRSLLATASEVMTLRHR